MAIRVLFDSTEINSNYIVGLKQSVNPYGEYFKIGNTICRQFTLDVLNDGFSTIPNKVYLYDNQTIYATLNIDNVDTENTKVTSFTLVDTMVMFNQDLTYTTGQTVKQILESVCATFGISLATQSFYMSDLAITWTDELKIRDFISYVAEVNGGYAYINASGNLVIESYSPTAQATINLVDCSSIKIGSKHLYDRVYVELAAATKYYPQTSSNDTLYLNPNNILFTDSGSYTIDATIQHIQSVINGLTFYNINIEKCPIQNVRTGQIIRVNNNGTYTPFICTIDTTYNSKWNGGYNLEIGTSKQEETQVSSNIDSKIKRIDIKVDREIGIIDQRVTGVETNIQNNYSTTTQMNSAISQSASSILQEVSGTYETQAAATASLALKVDKTDNNQIISMINASANNIILNAKKLVFGDLSNKYISLENKYSSNVAVGINMTGNGPIEMTTLGYWEVNNKWANNNGYRSNEIYVTNSVNSSTYRSGIYMYNYNNEASERNRIQLTTEDYGSSGNNSIELANSGYSSSTVLNTLKLYTSNTQSYINLVNKDNNKKMCNSINMNYDQYGRSIEIFNYNSSGTKVAWLSMYNNIDLSINDGSYITGVQFVSDIAYLKSQRISDNQYAEVRTSFTTVSGVYGVFLTGPVYWRSSKSGAYTRKW